MRPGDIYPSRKGLSVEIGNTDAEGRLILADALALAAEEEPDLLLDFATLTGAARVALGPGAAGVLSRETTLWRWRSRRYGRKLGDPVWRLPLWEPYDSQLDGKASEPRECVVERRMPARSPRRCSCGASSPSAGEMGAFRSLRLEPLGQARPAGGRRDSDGAAARRADRGARRALEREDMSDSFDKRLTPARPDLAARHLEGKVAGGALRRRPPHAGEGGRRRSEARAAAGCAARHAGALWRDGHRL